MKKQKIILASIYLTQKLEYIYIMIDKEWYH